ncbi:aldo/keto reductase [Labrys sedimenti]|uniref:aldo/keto reductase n=1 Tax=Labrys sedimenti TaxID=3106036 RepID=UPI002ACAD12A|nr:aldo/keto reductase [Labrys sp. ZIDIC5]MDZ5452856.1 aldo/keto reductase [Labrys sp. ZIDIC5]
MSPTIRFNDGKEIPQLGFGVWQVPNEGASAAVTAAIEAGYRSIDTAAIYGNEAGVGDALAASSVPVKDIFVTTKLWNGDQGYDTALRAFEASLKKLRLETIDLYLIHWPVPSRDLYVESWKALIKLREEGLVASIGVSNFQIAHLERLKAETGVVPAINQVELHPRFQQKALRAYHAKEGIATEAWSPLGQGTLLSDPALTAIGKKYGKSSAQVILRWHLDIGNVVIPKSVTPARIVENFQVFDFKLAPEDIAAIEKLDDPKGKIGPDPDSFAMV